MARVSPRFYHLGIRSRLQKPKSFFFGGGIPVWRLWILTFETNVGATPPTCRIAAGEREFNKRLSAGRVVSEHGNGYLKQRWQSFRKLPIALNKQKDVASVCDWMSACCVLHNLVNKLRSGADTFLMSQKQTALRKSSIAMICFHNAGRI